MRRRRGENEEERRRMMEASLLHATAVSLRQKAVCIIMGCHLISSIEGKGQGRWRGAFICAEAGGGRL